MHKLTRMRTFKSSEAYKEAENKMENLRHPPLIATNKITFLHWRPPKLKLNGLTFVIAEWLR